MSGNVELVGAHHSTNVWRISTAEGSYYLLAKEDVVNINEELVFLEAGLSDGYGDWSSLLAFLLKFCWFSFLSLNFCHSPQ